MRRGQPTVPGEAELVGWCFCSASVGSAGHRLEIKQPLRRDNHISALRGKRGCFARKTTVGPSSCSLLGVPAPSWAWIVSPFSNQIRAFTKNDVPCACSYWLCPEPAHKSPTAAGIIRGDKPQFLTHSRAKAIKTLADVPIKRYRVKKKPPTPSNLKHCTGVALNTEV